MGKPIFVKFRLYPGQDDDLLAWYQELERLPYGAKSQAIKEALRRGIGLVGNAASASAFATVDPDALRAAMEQVMERFLVDMRRVVEAALESAPGGRSHVEEEETDEGKALLEDFLSGLRLEDEDE